MKEREKRKGKKQREREREKERAKWEKERRRKKKGEIITENVMSGTEKQGKKSLIKKKQKKLTEVSGMA